MSNFVNGRTFDASEQDEEMLDSQNRLRAENLSYKVNRLKSLAFDMESEAREHHSLLDGLGNEFESGSGLLSGSMNRIHRVLNGGRNNRRAMCFIAAIVIAIFLTLYFTFFVFQHSKAH